MIRVHLVPAREFAHKDLGKITEDDIERYIARKREKARLAPKTIRNDPGVLHSIFELGLRMKWCVDNPVKLAEGPKVRRNRTRIRFLTPIEVEALCREPYPDVAPDVVGGYVRGEFNDPKSEGSSRSVPMPTVVAQELARLFDRTPWKTDDNLVFAHPLTGRPLDSSKILKRLRKAESRVGVRAVTFHELRHTFGTAMAAKGVPMRTIQEWMGHEDTKTTAIYSHYAPSHHEAAMVDAAFAVEQVEPIPELKSAA